METPFGALFNMNYTRRVDVNRYPLGAGAIAEALRILRVGDTLIFYCAAYKREFDRRAKELLN